MSGKIISDETEIYSDFLDNMKYNPEEQNVPKPEISDELAELYRSRAKKSCQLAETRQTRKHMVYDLQSAGRKKQMFWNEAVIEMVIVFFVAAIFMLAFLNDARWFVENMLSRVYSILLVYFGQFVFVVRRGFVNSDIEFFKNRARQGFYESIAVQQEQMVQDIANLSDRLIIYQNELNEINEKIKLQEEYDKKNTAC